MCSSRRDCVDRSLLDGNAVNEAFMEIVGKAEPAFAINTIVDDAGRAADLYCGNWKTSHRAACNAYSAEHTVHLAEKRDLVIVSCGGFPPNINKIEALQALHDPSRAVNQMCVRL